MGWVILCEMYNHQQTVLPKLQLAQSTNQNVYTCSWWIHFIMSYIFRSNNNFAAKTAKNFNPRGRSIKLKSGWGVLGKFENLPWKSADFTYFKRNTIKIFEVKAPQHYITFLTTFCFAIIVKPLIIGSEVTLLNFWLMFTVYNLTRPRQTYPETFPFYLAH